MALRRSLVKGLVSLLVAGIISFADNAYSQPKKFNNSSGSNNYKVSDFSHDSEKVLLARMIFGEARNCLDEEKVAVAYVALNRVHDGKSANGTDLKSVILKPYQFSCFNKNDANRVKLLDPMAYEPKKFISCLKLSEKILAGKYKDPTKGASNYVNLKVEKPDWRFRMEEIGKLNFPKGKSVHDFYKER